MSNTGLTYLIGGLCGVAALGAFVWFIAVPAWSSYSRTWERVASRFLALYVLAVVVGAQAVLAAAIAYYWDRIAA